MNGKLQKLITNLPKDNTLVLTVLLSDQNLESWDKNKQMTICGTPKLSLQMAISQVIACELSTIPSPKQILKALNYANSLSIQEPPEKLPAMIANG